VCTDTNILYILDMILSELDLWEDWITFGSGFDQEYMVTMIVLVDTGMLK